MHFATVVRERMGTELSAQIDQRDAVLDRDSFESCASIVGRSTA